MRVKDLGIQPVTDTLFLIIIFYFFQNSTPKKVKLSVPVWCKKRLILQTYKQSVTDYFIVNPLKDHWVKTINVSSWKYENLWCNSLRRSTTEGTLKGSQSITEESASKSAKLYEHCLHNIVIKEEVWKVP